MRFFGCLTQRVHIPFYCSSYHPLTHDNPIHSVKTTARHVKLSFPYGDRWKHLVLSFQSRPSFVCTVGQNVVWKLQSIEPPFASEKGLSTVSTSQSRWIGYDNKDPSHNSSTRERDSLKCEGGIEQLYQLEVDDTKAGSRKESENNRLQ